MANTIGMRIKEQRENAGLSQKELAELSGISSVSICRWEGGKAVPLESSVMQIADVLGIAPTEILGSKAKAEATQVAEEPKIAEPEPIKEELPRTRFCVSYRSEDEKDLRCLEMAIRHIREMNIGRDDMKRIHKILSKCRAELETKVLFGEDR